jgi:hypothetical protein
MEDKRYPIELEVITPLSVGAGNDNEWIKGLDFVQKDDKLYVIDMQKAATSGVDVEVLTQLFLKSDNTGISRLLGNKMEELSRYVFDLPAQTDNNIKTFLRTQFFDKPVVVGSSIKGSVRSALFNYLRTNEVKNEEVFGSMKDGTDFMRFIRIGDVEMPSTILVNTKLFNLRKEDEEWLGGWKHQMNKTTGSYNPMGFNTLYECVAPGNKGLGNISLAANAFSLLERFGQGKTPYAGKKRELLNEPIRHLFQIINDVTKEYLQKERAFFEKYSAERSDEVLDNIDALLTMIPADGSCCLLKMSAGVGFHSITGDWQFDDYDKTQFWKDGRNAGKKRYKSRKIADYNHRLQLMGFVRLRALTQNEASEREQSLLTQHDQQGEHLLKMMRDHETAVQQKRCEQLARQQAREEEERKERGYATLLQQARDAYLNDRLDEAKKKSEEAITLYPERAEANQLQADILKSIANANFQKEEQAKNLQKLSLPLADVITNCISAGNLAGTTAKWLKDGGHTWGEQEIRVFLDKAKQLSVREKKNLKSKLPQLKKLLSDEQANLLLKEIETI